MHVGRFLSLMYSSVVCAEGFFFGLGLWALGWGEWGVCLGFFCLGGGVFWLDGFLFVWCFFFFLNSFLLNGVENRRNIAFPFHGSRETSRPSYYLDILKCSTKNWVNSLQEEDENLCVILWLGGNTDRLYYKIIRYKQKEKTSIPLSLLIYTAS